MSIRIVVTGNEKKHTLPITAVLAWGYCMRSNLGLRGLVSIKTRRLANGLRRIGVGLFLRKFQDARNLQFTSTETIGVIVMIKNEINSKVHQDWPRIFGKRANWLIKYQWLD